MRIAEYARRTGLSERMLRHHHARGHLIPAGVDASTGYRTYHEAQVLPGRVVGALIRLGVSADAASTAVADGPDAVRALLLQVRQRVADVDAMLPGWPSSPATPTRPVALAARPVVVRRLTTPWHGVLDAVRRAVTTAGPAVAAPWWPGGPDGPLVRLVDPAYDGASVTLDVVLPWPPARVVPAGFERERLGPLDGTAVEVGSLARADLGDVLAAHRALDGATGDVRLQVYDARTEHLWVVRARPGSDGTARRARYA